MSNGCETRDGNCPCQAECPLGRAMNKIGGKWKMRILCALLQDGALRYNMLKKKVSSITNTMLASTLKELETDGLVRREEFLEVPIRVEYSVTKACRHLMPVLEQLARWEMTTF